ncbi:hypothetical protein GWI33_007303 [Rhynchophorus ferrugineus]|uniref:Uncharacterized protein n=1 Tax=Rhynchophorus ferrugineus TaxID=354439 RepID=A0A834ITF4_RHYFE|nr:hypothetical protein GWI33_007303 [Rhynchophorus ferrugineus]
MQVLFQAFLRCRGLSPDREAPESGPLSTFAENFPIRANKSLGGAFSSSTFEGGDLKKINPSPYMVPRRGEGGGHRDFLGEGAGRRPTAEIRTLRRLGRDTGLGERQQPSKTCFVVGRLSAEIRVCTFCFGSLFFSLPFLPPLSPSESGDCERTIKTWGNGPRA